LLNIFSNSFKIFFSSVLQEKSPNNSNNTSIQGKSPDNSNNTSKILQKKIDGKSKVVVSKKFLKFFSKPMTFIMGNFNYVNMTIHPLFLQESVKRKAIKIFENSFIDFIKSQNKDFFLGNDDENKIKIKLCKEIFGTMIKKVCNIIIYQLKGQRGELPINHDQSLREGKTRKEKKLEKMNLNLKL
jgi:hypothetical protein